MDRKFTDEDDALLAELGVVVEPEKAPSRTPREERIIAGFEEVQRFVETHGRAPRHGEDSDIFERLYAVRLDRIREQDDCRALLSHFDHQDFLSHSPEAASLSLEGMDDEALLSELGVESAAPDIGELRHVRPSAEKRAAEEIATRSKCGDFDSFRPLSSRCRRNWTPVSGKPASLVFRPTSSPAGFSSSAVRRPTWPRWEEEFTQRYGDRDARLRVIFDNGTESNMLRRSLQRALHKDEKGRRILETSAGPLFADETAAATRPAALSCAAEQGGHSVCRREPEPRPQDWCHHREGGNAHRRRTARSDVPDGEVEIVATYHLYNIDRAKLEKLIHRIFSPARLDIEIEDRFGNPVVPREWFLAPLDAINDAVEKIREGTITRYRYDAGSASLIERQ